MKNETGNGVIALLVVTAIAFIVIGGSGVMTKERWYETKIEGESEEGSKEMTDISSEKMDVSKEENISEALRYLTAAGETQGYLVTVSAKGYGGPIVMNVEFDAAGKTVSGLHILEHTETEGIGARITEPEYSKRFIGVKSPILPTGEFIAGSLKDGIYETKAQQAENGYTDMMKMTVEDGKIAEAAWDALGEDGTSKRHLSDIGEYQMTEDGLTWSQQAEALSAALAEHQSLDFLNYDDEGKTDAVAGVSISVKGFLQMAEDCLGQAGAGGTLIDGISGATISSKAVIEGINHAADFLRREKV